MNLVLSPVNVIFPVYSQERIGGGPGGFGWLATSIAFGTTLGTVVTGLAGKWLSGRTGIAAGVVLMAIAFLALGYATNLWTALAFTVLLGLAAPIVQIPMVTDLQEHVPPEMQGRVFASLGTVTAAATPIGFALAGRALGPLGSAAILKLAALGLMAVLLVAELYRRYVPAPRGSAMYE